jgi:hypothetical protein
MSRKRAWGQEKEPGVKKKSLGVKKKSLGPIKRAWDSACSSKWIVIGT